MAALTMGSVLTGAPSGASSDLAETMSPSQISCLTDCGAKYWFKYGLKSEDPKSSNLALGIAVDDAINASHRSKMETHADLPIEDVLMEFDAAWGEIEEQTQFRDDENPPAIAAAGRALVSLYMKEAAPKIQPIAVQYPVSGLIGGVQVNGVIDLIDDKRKIHDTKTSARKSSSISTRDLFQLSTYAILSPTQTVDVTIDQLVKTKTPQYVPLEAKLSKQDLRMPEIMYPLAQETIRAGYFLPNRNSTMCSWKQCSFARSCEKEFGGKVPGEVGE
jgi:hypothetical protein